MRPGDILGKRFELRAQVGQGGMGRVFIAVDRTTGRAVAVKVLRREAHPERFAREVAILATLQHDAIVRYVAHGTAESGDAYLVMQWVEGRTLADRIHANGAFTLDESLAVIARIASALAAMHALGLVHRDVKPENVLLQSGDPARAKLIDFGISRSADAAGLTRTGHAIGTLGYMAPEQARGQRDVDARADVFALGCLLFECITGNPLFSGTSALVVRARVLFESPPALAETLATLPPPVAALLDRMVAKAPEARPRDAAEVAFALTAIEEGAAVSRRLASSPVALGSEDGAARFPLPQLKRRVASEQGVVSVVLAALVGEQGIVAAETVALGDLGQLDEALRESVRPFGAEIELLADGSVLAVLASGDDPAAHALRAARCALALRDALAPTSRTPIFVATGRVAGEGVEPLDEVMARGARGLAVHTALADDDDAPARAPVFVDSLTETLLAGALALRKTAAAARITEP